MSRRKYRDNHYKDGGAVHAEPHQVPLSEADVPSPMAPSHEPPPAPAPHEPRLEPIDDDDNAVMRAYEAQRRAEEYVRQQREPPPPQTADQIIDGIPNLSEFKRSFLRANPHLLAPEHARSVSTHWEAAKRAGIPDDSDQMANYLLEQVDRDTGRHRSHNLPPPQPAPERNLSMPIVKKERSIPVSAPVSRSVPSASGQRDFGTTVTLNAEQRLVARNSFTDKSMSNEDKERLYAQNLMLMRRKQSNGEIG